MAANDIRTYMPAPTRDVLRNGDRNNSWTQDGFRPSCLNQHRAAMVERSKAVFRWRIVATSILEYVSGWCWHGFESHLQPFLLKYPELLLVYLFRSVFCFRLLHGGWNRSIIELLLDCVRLCTEPRRVHWFLLVGRCDKWSASRKIPSFQKIKKLNWN